jgi:Protein of Unknown function (DUF2784)
MAVATVSLGPAAMRDYRHWCTHTMDEILNVGFFVFHTSWVAFTCLGWIWRRTRGAQLAAVSLTALSWFGLGIWYGWGYCPCTDWHWQVRARLGYHDPPSYIQLLIREVTGVEPSPGQADALALVTLAGVTILSVMLRVRDRAAHGRRSHA